MSSISIVKQTSCLIFSQTRRHPRRQVEATEKRAAFTGGPTAVVHLRGALRGGSSSSGLSGGAAAGAREVREERSGGGPDLGKHLQRQYLRLDAGDRRAVRGVGGVICLIRARLN